MPGVLPATEAEREELQQVVQAAARDLADGTGRHGLQQADLRALRKELLASIAHPVQLNDKIGTQAPALAVRKGVKSSPENDLAEALNMCLNKIVLERYWNARDHKSTDLNDGAGLAYYVDVLQNFSKNSIRSFWTGPVVEWAVINGLGRACPQVERLVLHWLDDKDV